MLIIDSTVLPGPSTRRRFHTSCSLVFIRSGKWVEGVTIFVGECSRLLPVAQLYKERTKVRFKNKIQS